MLYGWTLFCKRIWCKYYNWWRQNGLKVPVAALILWSATNKKCADFFKRFFRLFSYFEKTQRPGYRMHLLLRKSGQWLLLACGRTRFFKQMSVWKMHSIIMTWSLAFTPQTRRRCRSAEVIKNSNSGNLSPKTAALTWKMIPNKNCMKNEALATLHWWNKKNKGAPYTYTKRKGNFLP